eukprot:c19491_g1_i3.p1 GENE.c19491_g1_i3~~c19491_g1_i3.p1  ORF type:complete len:392 (+),score=92.74 c19491_g1_i3:41-1177(+)
MIEEGLKTVEDQRSYVMNEIKQAHMFSKLRSLEIDPILSRGRRRAGSLDLSTPSATLNTRTNAPMRYENPNIELFEIKQTLGMGTFGRVRLIRDKITNKHYALKILKKADVVKLREVNHVKNEKNILQRLNCPFIVNMFGAFQDRRNLYMIMEFVRGGDLYGFLQQRGKFTPEHVAFLSAQVVIALHHLHSQSIAYRDLKPENVLLGHDGFLRLADFGSAKAFVGETKTMCGTPEYQAPELVRHKPHTQSVDCWSLGVLLYELCSGGTPFHADTPYQTYKRITAGEYEMPENIPDSLKDLISNLLKMEPAERLTIEEVKSHAFFSAVNWDELYSKRQPSPFAFETGGDDDTRKFKSYTEVGLFSGPIVDIDGSLFADF